MKSIFLSSAYKIRLIIDEYSLQKGLNQYHRFKHIIIQFDRNCSLKSSKNTHRIKQSYADINDTAIHQVPSSSKFSNQSSQSLTKILKRKVLTFEVQVKAQT